jgi:hypothetical protein
VGHIRAMIVAAALGPRPALAANFVLLSISLI